MHNSQLNGGTVQRRTTGSSGAVLEVVRQPKARLLLVDDDAQTLSAYQRVLRNTYDICTATTAQAARSLLLQHQFAAAILDLRLPGVRCCELVSYARECAPDTVRVVITGDPDVEAMTAAINDGQVFRFLLKPCVPSLLLETVADAVRRHRNDDTYRALLEETESASVGTLVDLLSITQPGSMGRPARIKELAENLASELGVQDTSIVGTAAQLSLVGFIIVPREVFLRAQRGVPLSVAEEALLHRLMPFVERLVATMPRFDDVRALLRCQFDPNADVPEHIAHLAAVLRTAIAFEALEDAGLGPVSALERLRRSRQHDESLLDALSWTCGTEARPRRSISAIAPRVNRSQPVSVPATIPTEVPTAASIAVAPVDDSVQIMPLADVSKGMRFAADVVAAGGVVLVARGQVVTSGLLDRIGSAWGSFAHTLFVRMSRDIESDEFKRGFERVV